MSFNFFSFVYDITMRGRAKFYIFIGYLQVHRQRCLISWTIVLVSVTAFRLMLQIFDSKRLKLGIMRARCLEAICYSKDTDIR